MTALHPINTNPMKKKLFEAQCFHGHQQLGQRSRGRQITKNTFDDDDEEENETWQGGTAAAAAITNLAMGKVQIWSFIPSYENDDDDDDFDDNDCIFVCEWTCRSSGSSASNIYNKPVRVRLNPDFVVSRSDDADCGSSCCSTNPTTTTAVGCTVVLNRREEKVGYATSFSNRIDAIHFELLCLQFTGKIQAWKDRDADDDDDAEGRETSYYDEKPKARVRVRALCASPCLTSSSVDYDNDDNDDRNGNENSSPKTKKQKAEKMGGTSTPSRTSGDEDDDSIGVADKTNNDMSPTNSIRTISPDVGKNNQATKHGPVHPSDITGDFFEDNHKATTASNNNPTAITVVPVTKKVAGKKVPAPVRFSCGEEEYNDEEDGDDLSIGALVKEAEQLAYRLFVDGEIQPHDVLDFLCTECQELNVDPQTCELYWKLKELL